jgi:hypothetical protein
MFWDFTGVQVKLSPYLGVGGDGDNGCPVSHDTTVGTILHLYVEYICYNKNDHIHQSFHHVVMFRRQGRGGLTLPVHLTSEAPTQPISTQWLRRITKEAS